MLLRKLDVAFLLLQGRGRNDRPVRRGELRGRVAQQQGGHEGKCVPKTFTNWFMANKDTLNGHWSSKLWRGGGCAAAWVCGGLEVLGRAGQGKVRLGKVGEEECLARNGSSLAIRSAHAVMGTPLNALPTPEYGAILGRDVRV